MSLSFLVLAEDALDGEALKWLHAIDRDCALGAHIRDSYSTTSSTSNGTNSYGIAYFNVDPGTTPGGQTTITITYYHTSLQPSGNPQYALFDQFVITRARSDGPGADLPEFPAPAAVLAGAAALGAGALYVHRQRRTRAELEPAAPRD